MDLLFEEDYVMDVVHNEEVTETEQLSEIDLVPEALQEVCVIGKEKLMLPTYMCENVQILEEMFDAELLNEVLTETDKEQLHSYLPNFADEDQFEKDKTWELLFTGQNIKFGNPVKNFIQKLESGWYNQDIATARKLFHKMQQKNTHLEKRDYYINLLQSVVISRQRLLEAASQLPPGQPVKVQPHVNHISPSPIPKPCSLTIEDRVRKRYFAELRSIDAVSSEDEVYPEGPPASLSKKQRRHLCTVQGSLSSEFKPIQSTLSPKIYNQQVIVDNKLDKTEDEFNKSQYLDFGSDVRSAESIKKTSENRRIMEPFVDVLSRVSGSKNPYDITEDTYKLLLHRHWNLRREGKNLPELDTRGIRLEDVAERVRLCALNKRTPQSKTLDISPKKMREAVSECSSSEEAESESEAIKKIKIKKPSTTRPSKVKPVKSKVEKMDIADIVDKNEVVKAEPEQIPPPSLTQDTHSSFFALLRDILVSSETRVNRKHFFDALTVWNNSPISPLNEWYSQLMSIYHRSNGWLPVIQSALEFLITHGFVECESKLATGTFSWTGVGRDSDLNLQELYNLWIQQQETTREDKAIDIETSNDLNDSLLNSTPDPHLTLGTGLELGEDTSDLGTSFFDTSDVIHPPRSMTSWVVRPSTAEERASYQEQERLRYSQPHKAFTFRQHGYESIVGPVKGVYSPAQGVGQPGTKVRGHNLMVPDRPACVTLLSLVRDAAARLPNGEGTRADICELMKDSQYLATGAEASLHSVVSGALDRLHYEADPCVKYDSGRKVWIYLHRHRSEAEFEQLHKQHQGMPSRAKKPRSEQRRNTAAGAPTTSGTGTAKSVKTATVVTATVTSTATPPVVEIPSAPVHAIPNAVPRNPPKVNSVITPLKPETSKPITVPTVSPSPIAASGQTTIQTFQITTSTGVQTIRVAAPPNLPTALLARTLQLSAQQQGGVQGVVQKITPPTSGTLNGNSNIKQVILSPPPTTTKATSFTLISNTRPTAGTIVPTPTSSASIIRLNVPVTSSSTAPIRTRLPATPIRLAGRQAVTATAPVTPPVQTLLIRPPAAAAAVAAATTTTTTAVAGSVSAASNPPPRLVMVNNKLINLNSTSVSSPNRMVRPSVAVAAVRKPVPPPSSAAAAARPVLARVVTAPAAAQQQQVISLESLLSLASQQQKGGTKTGVVQLPLSALTGLNVAATSSNTQPTTVLLQNVKGAQSILLPAGFQGGTINIRGVRLATVAQSAAQPKQAFVARLVTPQQPQQQQQVQQPQTKNTEL